MPTNISGRVILIMSILWACLSLIFPSVPPSLFWFLHPTQPISFSPDLKPGIDMVAPFGTSLHVSGRDAGALDKAIALYRKRKGLDWKRSEPSLEDVFIDLMRRSQDNFP